RSPPCYPAPAFYTCHGPAPSAAGRAGVPRAVRAGTSRLRALGHRRPPVTGRRGVQESPPERPFDLLPGDLAELLVLESRQRAPVVPDHSGAGHIAAVVVEMDLPAFGAERVGDH